MLGIEEHIVWVYICSEPGKLAEVLTEFRSAWSTILTGAGFWLPAVSEWMEEIR